MLFADILDKKTKNLEPAFDLLFDKMVNNQKHPGDLLLVLINGFYNPDVHKWTNLPIKLSPYMIGPDKEGHSETLHYDFIHQYRTTHLARIVHSEYVKEFEWSPDKREQIEELQKIEGTTIQLEMLIYLKIWEADSFIKRFYQYARLINAESYDWHFKISQSSRESISTGKRHDIIRKLIRDKLHREFPTIYLAFKNSYKTQIRNSIAHSNYSFQSRYIHPNNYIEGDPANSIKAISFDGWIDIFHDTIVIYNQYIRLKNKINDYYSAIAKTQNSQFEILINRKDPNEAQELKILEFRSEWNDWKWDQNS
jgi:hypothetical protein